MQTRLSLALAAALLLTPALAQGAVSTTTPTASATSKSSTNHAEAGNMHQSVTLHVPTVNVNMATLAQLEHIPGMTPRLAREVIAARAKGPFKNKMDFMRRVKGVGPRTLKKFGPYLKFA